MIRLLLYIVVGAVLSVFVMMVALPLMILRIGEDVYDRA